MERRAEHGGGVDAAAARYGVPRERWLDLSTGINPYPYPLPGLDPQLWQRLPDEALMANLRRAAARHYRVDDETLVVPAPGSQALIRWLPRLLPPSAVAVVGPTYNEHAAAWAAAGHHVEEVGELPDPAARPRVVIVVNPNNPDGRVFPPERPLAETRHRLVVVDEAFADTAPEISVAPWVGRPNLLVLRSLGKFFGLAGVRLGFALAAGKIASELRAALGPWPVSGPAAAVGAAALADEPWITATRTTLRGSAARLDAVLARHRLEVTGGTTLFRLAVHPRAGDLHEHLARAGILTRAFAAEPQRLRLGLPAGDEAFARLEAALADWPSSVSMLAQPSQS